MSGQGCNQSVASPMTKMKSQLECPVCFNIPRDLPVPMCPSGHIVCRPCKTRVKDCPTCRQPMPANMTNSLVGALIEQVQHSCKYSDQGCEVKMMLQDLVIHEKQCSDRTIRCPYPGCTRQLKLKDFDTHALEDSPLHSYNRIVSRSLNFTAFKNGDIYDTKWGMACFKALDELFHVKFRYYNPIKCFVFTVWLAKSPNVASSYVVNILIKGEKKSLCFDGIKVSSVEDVPSMLTCMEENGNFFLCLPVGMAKNISVKKQDGAEGIIEEKLHVLCSFKKI